MRSKHRSTVMPALVAGIHVFSPRFSEQDVDGRDKPGHDCGEEFLILLRPVYSSPHVPFGQKGEIERDGGSLCVGAVHRWQERAVST